MMKRSDESRCDVNALWRRCDQKGVMEMGVMKKDETEKVSDGMGVMKKNETDKGCVAEGVIRRERWNGYYEKREREKMRWKGLMCGKREQQRV